MDGYAVKAEDVAAATATTPVVLPVVGDIAAGSTSPFTVQPGLCVRIMTGAPMPPGADAIVPVEDTDGGRSSRHPRGTDLGRSVPACRRGCRSRQQVWPPAPIAAHAQLGLIAAVGRDRVVVRPKPRVVIVSTGSELVELGDPLLPGQIYDSKRRTLTAAACEARAPSPPAGIVGGRSQAHRHASRTSSSGGRDRHRR